MQEKQINTFDNTQIYYKYKKYKNSKPTLIFVHGLSGNQTVWNNIVSYFNTKKYSTIAIDLHGHGKSSNKKDKKRFTLENFAKDINVIITKEKIKNPILIGHCLGGMIALVYETMYPHKIKGFVLLAATPANFTKYQYSLQRYFPTFFYSLSTKILGKITERINRKNKPYINFSKLSQHNALSIVYYDLKTTSLTAYTYSILSMINFDIRKKLPEIKTPTLVIIGEHDKVMHQKSAEELASKIKNAELKIMKNTDHLIPLRRPRELARIIEKWMKKEQI